MNFLKMSILPWFSCTLELLQNSSLNIEVFLECMFIYACVCICMQINTYTHIKTNYDECRWLHVKDMQADMFLLPSPSNRSIGKPSLMEKKVQDKILLTFM